ncbi:hypothetical protein MHI57_24645 [Cytobacillus sp. FSL K6-0129]|uniref:hypothetical protein n=1 Tax=Cytobacillus sp. FSL K6-0129 TaxID=2921421 RepID=UPI0030FC2051
MAEEKREVVEEEKEIIAIPMINGIAISGFFDFIYDGTVAEVSFVLLPENLPILRLLNRERGAYLGVKFGERDEEKVLMPDCTASIVGLDSENGNFTVIKVGLRKKDRKNGMLTSESFRKVGETL